METHNKQTEDQKDFSSSRGLAGFYVGWFFFFSCIFGFAELAVALNIYIGGISLYLGYLVIITASVVIALYVAYREKEHRAKWDKMPVAEKGFRFFILLLVYFFLSYLLWRWFNSIVL